MADNKSESKVDYSVDDKGIAWLHLNDPIGKNVFSHQFVDDFIKALDKADVDEPRCMVIHGLPDVFAAGADKESLFELAEGKFVVRDLLVSERIVNTRFPVISAMEGHAMGGGLVIGLCSDIVVMAQESRYGAVFMNMGFTPGMGTTTLLQGLVGPFLAAEMMYTGRRFRGRELAERGAGVNHIVPKEKVLATAKDVALQIAEKNTKSVYLLKYALSAPKKKLLTDARLQEDMMHALSFGYPETKKIIRDMYAGS